jgi:hypothetical protein
LGATRHGAILITETLSDGSKNGRIDLSLGGSQTHRTANLIPFHVVEASLDAGRRRGATLGRHPESENAHRPAARLDLLVDFLDLLSQLRREVNFQLDVVSDEYGDNLGELGTEDVLGRIGKTVRE